MRIVVIGAGRMGVIRAEDLAADGRVDEIVIANRNAARAGELAARLQQAHPAIRITTTPWGEWPDADGYAVTTATDTHAELIGALASRGKPLLVEKPLAMTLEECDALMAVTDNMQIGFQRRFDAGIRGLKEAIDSGQLGTLYTLTMTAHDIAPGTPEFIAGSGGTFRDMLVHDLDLARWVTGSEVATVYATGAVRNHPDYAAADDFDVVTATLTTEDGVPVIVSGTRHDPVGHDIRMEAFGSRDSMSAGLVGRTPLHVSESGDDHELLGDYLGDLPRGLLRPFEGFMDRFRAAFTAETSAYVDFVRGERANPCTPAEARAALALAIACDLSAREGRVVRMSEIG
jgi:myo-inositol 2-dehydrogenase/D-chiro-inositol 1-dehydrogenase